MPSMISPILPSLNSIAQYGLIASFVWPLVAAGSDYSPTSRTGYTYGQPMPVTCLNRTIDSGEHITDDLGKLQYIPFPTCNETFLPLAIRYGVSETLNCTINALPDELYHLLEYYVHSDVPMTCRVPTGPLDSTTTPPDSKNGDDTTDLAALSQDGPPYTPITFAVQGTLQRSHLHIWTDMNVLAHNIDSSADQKTGKKKNKNKNNQAGYIVAGTAYSVPEFDLSALKGEKPADGESEAEAVAEAAREPWTAGHGTKVIRGEPLTFTFHVSWIEGGRGIGWPGYGVMAGETEAATTASAVGGFFSRVFFFGFAASVGALAAVYWERNRRRGWRGDGILGVPSRGKGSVGISYGNGAKANGYGGYSAAAATSAVGGGGFMSGKRD
ncbi:hypothetical protein FE257_011203 [Aspergillus nanangensis]|uniref:Uncharacterized protein n=1 Tax=Aspergillus nanangensis TaxID=2582783 RepID=A0AAD4CHQ3_ASPNN|nr:hypothetical protein FE257_011203 [Aspergillus nanangensis]